MYQEFIHPMLGIFYLASTAKVAFYMFRGDEITLLKRKRKND
jgi:hypothetical protein